MSNLLRNRSRRATFLCYHSVAGRGPRYLTVEAGLFARQLEEIERRGLAFGGLAELEEAADGSLDRPTVFLTFDDGFRDNYETVMPLLRERGAKAFVFVVPPLLAEGSALAWPEVAPDQERSPETMRSLDWAMAAEMKEAGFEVGSHTLTHPHLHLLHGQQLRDELSDSRAQIAARLGSCDTIAYPFGSWSKEVAEAARDCGYRFAFTLPTEAGQWGAERHSIPRINVDFRDEGRRFTAKLSRPGKELFLSPAAGARRRVSRRTGPAQ